MLIFRMRKRHLNFLEYNKEERQLGEIDTHMVILTTRKTV